MTRLSIASRTAALVAAAVLLAAPVALAQQSDPPSPEMVLGIKAANFGKTTLEEGHFSYSLPAGSSVQDGIILINYKDEPIVVGLYAADLIEAKGGGLAPAQRDAEMEEVGAWLELEDPELATVGVPANERVTIPFRLNVPRGTPPGDYPGAVVAALDTGKGADGLLVQTRTALMVRLTVPGKIDIGARVSHLKAQRVSEGYRFDVDVRNTGNVLFTIVGTVELRRGGRVIGRVPLTPEGIYVIPDGKTELRGIWKDPPKLGRVKAVAQVAVAINKKPSGTFSSPARTLTLIPVLIAGIAGLFVLIGGSMMITRRLRRIAASHDDRQKSGRGSPLDVATGRRPRTGAGAEARR